MDFCRRFVHLICASLLKNNNLSNIGFSFSFYFSSIGKGGVGKTTTSSCLAVAMAAQRRKVLLISTDPAHNLGDAFEQKFTKEPTLVNGFTNLFAMEIDPIIESEEVEVLGEKFSLKNSMKELGGALPGMDEISSFMEIMRQVNSMDYDLVVFDTAPTGHTLRMLSFPQVLEKAVNKFLGSGLSSLIGQFSGMLGFGGASGSEGSSSSDILEKIQKAKKSIEEVKNQFQNPELTTFVCVCIPEFLSVYETERLVQELTRYEIDTHNVVVNQIVFKDRAHFDSESRFCSFTTAILLIDFLFFLFNFSIAASNCKTCDARCKIQGKYLEQIHDLYGEDFHVVKLPLLGQEVRGVPALKSFSENLFRPYVPPHAQ